MNGQINLGDIKPINYFLTIAVVVGLMFAFITPDEDLKYGWLGHLLHWQIQTLIPMALAIVVLIFLPKSKLINTRNPWFKLIISGLIACLITTPIALCSDILLTGQQLEQTLIIELLNEFIAITPPILVCWIAINAPFQLGYQLQKSSVTDSVKEELPNVIERPLPSFLEFVPTEMRGELIYLKSELHYLQVVTTKGISLILYTLKKAVEELAETEGLQPHRSFWVNKDFINEVTKQGREGKLIMSNGDQIPISRSNLQKIHAMFVT
ncbi:MAG: LytTR family transcriptional regulator [Acidiferrobacterales bacterium]|nr:LytTR family transcriptional regulator [Acidiferrobacterales bacterium]